MNAQSSVENEIVAGLRYLQVVKRAGVKGEYTAPASITLIVLQSTRLKPCWDLMAHKRRCTLKLYVRAGPAADSSLHPKSRPPAC
jgi:hypothetical protein